MPIPEAAGSAGSTRELLRDRVHARIKEAILTGVLLPGERLDEAELRRWLQVSGTPIRQALQTLTVEGLVQTSPQSYSAVIAPRPEQAQENLQALGVLVAGAATLTLPHLGPDGRAALSAQADEVIGRLEEGDIPAVTGAAETLFGTVVAACPNPVLVELIARSAPSLGYHVTVGQQGLDADLTSLARAYENLRAAIDTGDDAGAVAAIKTVFDVGHPAT